MAELNGSTRVLVTGGAGFIGSNLLRFLNGRGVDNIVVLDNESLGDRRTITPYRHEFVHGDIRDEACLRRVMAGADMVVHLAADTRVMDSIEDPSKNYDVNVFGTFLLLSIARELRVPRIVMASTGGAILGDAEPPIHEDMVARPLAPYGASKLAAEGYCSAFSAAYGMSIACLRFSNIYGPGSLHKGSVVAHFYKRLLEGEEIVVFGDGSQVRDFLYVEDLMEGIARAMGSSECGVFQLGSGRPTSVNELLDEMRRVLGDDFRSPVRYADFRAGEVRATWCNIGKAESRLGFAAPTVLAEGLRHTWNWFLEARKSSAVGAVA